MPCKVVYLNSAGIMGREVPGVDALAKAYPKEWCLYVSLNCFPRGQDPVEIDAFLAMDDRVVVFELKDWNGKLTAQGDRWFIGGQSRGRSAVIQVNEKAKKLKTVLSSEIPVFRSVWVDYRVILTATSNKSELPESEKQYVWNLQQACSIAEPKNKLQLLDKKSSGLVKPLLDQIDQVVGNPKLFRASEADFSGYRVTEEDVFVHPDKVWRDHRAERKNDPRLKALVRTWAFNNLPATLNSAARRRLIAERESRAFAHLAAMGSELVEGNAVLRSIGEEPTEILTSHVEVRALLPAWTTLDRFLARVETELGLEDRVALATALLNLIAGLHKHGVAHRDLGPRCVWLANPSKVALSGLISSHIPEDETVYDWLPVLRAYSRSLPEDPASTATATERDVYLGGMLVAQILGLHGKEPKSSALSVGAEAFLPWLDKCLTPDTSQRYKDAKQSSLAFAEIAESFGSDEVDHSLLDAFETREIPYQKYPSTQTMPSTAERAVYKAVVDGIDVVVKVWNGLVRGLNAESDLAILRLMTSVAQVMAAPVSGLPKFVDAKISPVGPYVVYEYGSGTPLASAQLSATQAVSIARALVGTISALHALGCDHGDLNPHNILVDPRTNGVRILDPFDISLGAHRNTPTYCPGNAARLSQQAIDRFATLKIIDELITGISHDVLTDLHVALASELDRDVIHTLDVALAAIVDAERELGKPARQRIQLSGAGLTTGALRSDGGVLYVTKLERSQSRATYYVTGSRSRVVFEERNDALYRYDIEECQFAEIAHASRSAWSIEADIYLSPGPEKGWKTYSSWRKGQCLQQRP